MAKIFNFSEVHITVDNRRDMKTIYKYDLIADDYVELAMPRNAWILSVKLQKGIPRIWALVDTEQPLETRTFRIAGTGHPIEEPTNKLQFVGTFLMVEENLVFHLFEVIKEIKGESDADWKDGLEP